MSAEKATTSRLGMVRVPFALQVVSACGVVFGDIGTSVLYTFKEIFFGPHTYGHVSITQGNILGAVSLVFWALVVLVTIKYACFVLYADHNGEGGTFALLAQLQGAQFFGSRILTGFLLILSAGLLYGEGLITPAISILSAVEGLKEVTDQFDPYVVWIAAGILLALFSIQRTGTAKVGLWFGYIMVVWFGCIGMIGAVQIWRHPQVVVAVNPWYGVTFLSTLGFWKSLVVLGFVTLAVTGVEAMFADMGHFGRLPIQVGWAFVAFPCLLLNYCGQGGFLLGQLQDGGVLPALHLFYATFQDVIPGKSPLLLMVALATMATIIASQALITGAYSLTSQAIALGYGGRMEILHTSSEHRGQIYMRTFNWLLCAGCLGLIFTFGSSSKLAAAYGLAVSGVMWNTSITMIPLATTRWAWSLPRAAVLFGFFACMEATFLFANTLKFAEGGFIPLLIGLGLFAAMSNYHWGRTTLLATAYAAYANSRTMRWFLALKQRLIDHGGVLRERSRVLKEAERIDIFMTSRPVMQDTDGVPVVLRAYLKRHGTVAKQVVLLTIDQQQRPVVEPEQRYTITTFGADVYGIVAAYGYMEKPDVPSILHEVNAHPALQKCDLSLANIEIGEEEILVDPALPWFRKLWVGAFIWQLKLSTPAHRFFGLTWHTPAFDDVAGIDHLSKTVVPVFVNAYGATIRLPDRDKRV